MKSVLGIATAVLLSMIIAFIYSNTHEHITTYENNPVNIRPIEHTFCITDSTYVTPLGGRHIENRRSKDFFSKK